MNLVDKFLETVTDEFGNKIDFSNVEVEGFEGDIILNNKPGYASVDLDGSLIFTPDYDNEEVKMVDEFIEYVQQKMKEHKAFVKDQVNTQKSLNNYGKF